jgi:hypothetical protein
MSCYQCSNFSLLQLAVMVVLIVILKPIERERKIHEDKFVLFLLLHTQCGCNQQRDNFSFNFLCSDSTPFKNLRINDDIAIYHC